MIALKNKKWPCLENSLTDQHEIRHGDTHWPFEPYGS